MYIVLFHFSKIDNKEDLLNKVSPVNNFTIFQYLPLELFRHVKFGAI